jgi:hypothetical protein
MSASPIKDLKLSWRYGSSSYFACSEHGFSRFCNNCCTYGCSDKITIGIAELDDLKKVLRDESDYRDRHAVIRKHPLSLTVQYAKQSDGYNESLYARVRAGKIVLPICNLSLTCDVCVTLNYLFNTRQWQANIRKDLLDKSGYIGWWTRQVSEFLEHNNIELEWAKGVVPCHYSLFDGSSRLFDMTSYNAGVSYIIDYGICEEFYNRILDNPKHFDLNLLAQ